MQTRLPFFGVVRVSGEDRASFLHGQLSNDINNLAIGQACYATYNTPKGRVLVNMLVVNRGEDLLLVMAQDLTEAIVKRLRMFVLRAKVVFELMPDLAVSGELADNAEPHPATEPQLSFPAQIQENTVEITLPHTGRLKISAAENAAEYQAGAENAWNLHEIRSGYPWICAATKEAAVAQMLNQHIIGAVHFRKGCYPGQEIIARAQYRGQVKRGLAVLSGNSLEAAGIAIKVGGEEAGVILNTALTEQGSLSLAVIKFSATEAALTDADSNALKQEELFFTVEKD